LIKSYRTLSLLLIIFPQYRKSKSGTVESIDKITVFN